MKSLLPRSFCTALISFLVFVPTAATTAQTRTQVLAGYAAGLYRIVDSGEAIALWNGGEVRKIVRGADGWYILSSAGIFHSGDLVNFASRTAGLPVKTIKRWENGGKSFVREPADLKDLELDPEVAGLVTARTNDEAFVSRDGGRTWTSYGNPGGTAGMKAVCVVSSPAPLLFASHPIRGVFSKPLGSPKAAWTLVSGFALQPTMTSPDEVADIVARSGSGGIEVWASNSFLPRIYRYDTKTGVFSMTWAGNEDFASIESLCPSQDGLLYVTDGDIRRRDLASGKTERDERAWKFSAAATATGAREGLGRLGALLVSGGDPSSDITLSELWLLEPGKPRTGANPRAREAFGRSGIYLRTDLALKSASWAGYGDLLRSRALDMVVLDVKDDAGRLRFEPRDPWLKSIARVASPIDLDAFLAEMQKRGIATVARIVVFKDRTMYERKGGAYAVWDSREKTAWRGWLGTAAGGGEIPEEGRKYMAEYWVDPYCEEIWEYNVAVANEAIARGFDEIQFDYLRFPTDGENLADATCRWRDPGMDKESALMSFLGYARENVNAPIGIDIYGANGWYRSGVRTGQDVELLSRYVDVICPMFYPSHFEQGFMAQPPEAERPYRIYWLGTLRTEVIARGRVVVRPYVQAFFLKGASYDEAHYGLAYVAREAAGVRDAGNPGLTYWNNSGRYGDIPKPELGEGPRASPRF
ncbi:MAG: hypothetical protein NT080_04100 [Spirochaetes bacterium]|nr:hypothetical protein [Spirochaetota bacterium]